mmetsp:Transcript_791/g.2888  ORF Transcript_791/g.2888 Transcript_791/m.2888 type:complete len:332 (+) Transcript_791:497-1492(+)
MLDARACLASRNSRMWVCWMRARRSRRMCSTAADSASCRFMRQRSPKAMQTNMRRLSPNHNPGTPVTICSKSSSPHHDSRTVKSPVSLSSNVKPRLPPITTCRISSELLALSLARKSSSSDRVLVRRLSWSRNMALSLRMSVFCCSAARSFVKLCILAARSSLHRRESLMASSVPSARASFDCARSSLSPPFLAESSRNCFCLSDRSIMRRSASSSADSWQRSEMRARIDCRSDVRPTKFVMSERVSSSESSIAHVRLKKASSAVALAIADPNLTSAGSCCSYDSDTSKIPADPRRTIVAVPAPFSSSTSKASSKSPNTWARSFCSCSPSR